MIRKLFAGALFLGGAAIPAAAAVTVLNASDFQQFSSANGGPYATADVDFGVGRAELVPNLTLAFETALDFDLTPLPNGSVVNQAILTFRTDRFDLAGSVLLKGYADDGIVTASDLNNAGSDLAQFSFPDSSFASIEVTSFVSQMFQTSPQATVGFSLRQSPLGQCSNAGANALNLCAAGIASLGLAISYTVPPTSVPEPASWAMMLVGLGLVGVALRRRQQSTGTLTSGSHRATGAVAACADRLRRSFTVQG